MSTTVLESAEITSGLPVSAEFVASAGAATVGMGERLGMYDAFSRLGSLTNEELAAVTRLPIWLTEGWLAAQVTAGYLAFDERTASYRPWCELPPAA